ncbi:hypothetical protein [Janthinobacterium agaricidamnosum]|uniref:Uncharacterized protein n=1 Tax=Janthinobacterium agaricidamnosum NBRC 102515 = DSM 9628 TaxID=1349767 RepID=W0V5L2_9BURK|nr:hypothetical protein GJA_2002 [Janthinobacterium agaricidamnosum NBRC 102515 = DSM 9628]
MNRALDDKLRERLLLARAAAGDRLMLADGTMLAALDGSRVLTPAERAVLAASPLTLRRFRALSLQRRQAARPPAWSGSQGWLRAAAGAAPLVELVSDDACWRLHFLARGDQPGHGWSLVLKLAAGAPFASDLMRAAPLLRVLDGAGAVLLQGRLDSDGECEQDWPCPLAPAPHLQLHGARFSVMPAA